MVNRLLPADKINSAWMDRWNEYRYTGESHGVNRHGMRMRCTSSASSLLYKLVPNKNGVQRRPTGSCDGSGNILHVLKILKQNASASEDFPRPPAVKLWPQAIPFGNGNSSYRCPIPALLSYPCRPPVGEAGDIVMSSSVLKSVRPCVYHVAPLPFKR